MTKGILHWSQMTPESFKYSLCKTEPGQLTKTYLRKLDEDSAKVNSYLVLEPEYETIIDESITFDNDRYKYITKVKPVEIDTDQSHAGCCSGFSPQGNKYAMPFKFPLLRADEVYVTVWLKNSEDSWLVLFSKDSLNVYSAANEPIETKGGWSKYHILASFENSPKPDTLHFYINNISRNAIWFDDLRLQTRKISYVHKKDRFW